MLGSFEYVFTLLEIPQPFLLMPCKLPLSKLLPLTFHISSYQFTGIVTCPSFLLLAIITLEFWSDCSGVLVLHL